MQEAVLAAKAVGPLGSSSGRGLPQIERVRLNVHANQVRSCMLDPCGITARGLAWTCGGSVQGIQDSVWVCL